MAYVTQTRALSAPPMRYTDTTHPSPTDIVSAVTGGSQTTTSWRTGRRFSDENESHRYFGATQGEFVKQLVEEYRQKPGTFDSGHTFYTEKNYLGTYSKPVRLRGNPSVWYQADYRYDGPIFLDPTYIPLGKRGTFPDPASAYTKSTVDGTKAISLTAPTAPSANLAVGLAELVREGFPRAVGSTLLNPKFYDPRNFGDEFLNVQFGIKPLISDVRQAAHAVVNAGKILRQLERDSGRNVRRQFGFPEETSTEVLLGTGVIFTNTMPSRFQTDVFSRTGGPSTTTITTTRRKWFSGAYTYHMPSTHINSLKAVRSAEEKAHYLLGLELTPEVLYNLTPWSWLADWFANIGDVVSNVTRFASDNLVLRYGYMMCETNVHMIRTLTGPSTYYGGSLGELVFESGTIRKERFRSTPFGFGSVVSGFTQGQWNILAALGMSRTPGSLTTDL